MFFFKSLDPCALGEISLSIERIDPLMSLGSKASLLFW